MINITKSEVTLKNNDSHIEIFDAFTKPGTITEEEVMFHKEKKICLVCKGKVGRYMFMCPECDGLYCQNCANALENSENMCWVCNGPINSEKPVTPLENEKEVESKVLDKSSRIIKSDKDLSPKDKKI